MMHPMLFIMGLIMTAGFTTMSMVKSTGVGISLGRALFNFVVIPGIVLLIIAFCNLAILYVMAGT